MITTAPVCQNVSQFSQNVAHGFREMSHTSDVCFVITYMIQFEHV